MPQQAGNPDESGQARGERRRRQILDAALRVIAEQGVGGLTYRKVADRSGASLGTLTYHFPSRRKLLAAAFRLHLDQVHERGRHFDAQSRPDWQAGRLTLDELSEAVAEMLEAMARDERESAIASHELALEMTRDARLLRELAGAFDAHHRNTAALVGRVTRGRAADEDAAILAAVFDSLVMSCIAQPKDAARAARLRRIVRRVLEKLL